MTLPEPYARALTREEINALPVRRYEGEVCLVTNADELARARADLEAESVVGFDTETRPSFRVGEHHPPALAQAASARAVYLFSLRTPMAYGVLAAMLSAARPAKAGVALAGDVKALRALTAFEPRSLVDLGEIARRHGLKQSGVRALAALFLGFRVPKGTKTSNWAAARLSPQQIAYAATDAWTCRELYLRFSALGLLGAAAAPRAASPASPPPTPHRAA